MIIKKKMTHFPPQNLPLDEKGKHLSRIGADELILETYEFLKTFYRGCFDAYISRIGYRNLFICIENFAAVVKGIVKAVFGRELIVVRFGNNEDKLFMDMEFNTDFVTEEKRRELNDLAFDGGFNVVFSDRLARIEIEFLPNSVPYVNSISTRIVYNTLIYVFNNKKI